MKPFFVYMLRCSDGSYYVGHTDDLERRMGQHAEGTSREPDGSRYARDERSGGERA